MSVSESLPTLELEESSSVTRDVTQVRSHDVTMLCIAVAVLVLSFALRILRISASR